MHAYESFFPLLAISARPFFHPGNPVDGPGAAGQSGSSLEQSAQTTRYVKPGGSGSATGASWANASANLQAIINASKAGDQIWVAQGTYKPTSGADRFISFAMKDGVAMYGGFAGNETSLSQRPVINPVLYKPSGTILSGDIGTVGDNSDNSIHVIHNITPLTESAILDGFVITGGNATGGETGGGILNDASAGIDLTPTIRNCTVRGNTATSRGGGYV